MTDLTTICSLSCGSILAASLAGTLGGSRSGTRAVNSHAVTFSAWGAHRSRRATTQTMFALGFVTGLATFDVALYSSKFGLELLLLYGVELSVSGGSHVVDAAREVVSMMYASNIGA